MFIWNFLPSNVRRMLHHGSVGASWEWNKRNLTLTLTLNLLLHSIVFYNKICVFIIIFTDLSFRIYHFYGLFTAEENCPPENCPFTIKFPSKIIVPTQANYPRRVIQVTWGKLCIVYGYYKIRVLQLRSKRWFAFMIF